MTNRYACADPENFPGRGVRRIIVLARRRVSEAYSRKIYCENSINFHFSEGGGGLGKTARDDVSHSTRGTTLACHDT